MTRPPDSVVLCEPAFHLSGVITFASFFSPNHPSIVSGNPHAKSTEGARDAGEGPRAYIWRTPWFSVPGKKGKWGESVHVRRTTGHCREGEGDRLFSVCPHRMCLSAFLHPNASETTLPIPMEGPNAPLFGTGTCEETPMYRYIVIAVPFRAPDLIISSLIGETERNPRAGCVSGARSPPHTPPLAPVARRTHIPHRRRCSGWGAGCRRDWRPGGSRRW